MSKLVIVESPTKVKSIKKYLGSDYDVMASMGHIRDLPKSKIGIDVDNNFKLEYINMPEKKDLIKSWSLLIWMMMTGKPSKRSQMLSAMKA